MLTLEIGWEIWAPSEATSPPGNGPAAHSAIAREIARPPVYGRGHEQRGPSNSRGDPPENPPPLLRWVSAPHAEQHHGHNGSYHLPPQAAQCQDFSAGADQPQRSAAAPEIPG